MDRPDGICGSDTNSLRATSTRTRRSREGGTPFNDAADSSSAVLTKIQFPRARD